MVARPRPNRLPVPPKPEHYMEDTTAGLWPISKLELIKLILIQSWCFIYQITTKNDCYLMQFSP